MAFRSTGVTDIVIQHIKNQPSKLSDPTGDARSPTLTKFSQDVIVRALKDRVILDRLLVMCRIREDDMELLQALLKGHSPEGRSERRSSIFLNGPLKGIDISVPRSVHSLKDWAVARAESWVRLLQRSVSPGISQRTGPVVPVDTVIHEKQFRRLWKNLYRTVEEAVENLDARGLSALRKHVVFNKYYQEPSYVDESGEFTTKEVAEPSYDPETNTPKFDNEDDAINHANSTLIRCQKRVKRVSQYLNHPAYSSITVTTLPELAVETVYRDKFLLFLPHRGELVRSAKLPMPSPPSWVPSATVALLAAVAIAMNIVSQDRISRLETDRLQQARYREGQNEETQQIRDALYQEIQQLRAVIQARSTHPHTISPALDPSLLSFMNNIGQPIPARCVGASDGRDGLTPALKTSGNIVLAEEADILLTRSGTDPPFSLRQFMGTLSELHQPPEPQCYFWDSHELDWNHFVDDTQTGLCHTDMIGQTCVWRSDWSIPACTPDGTLCACPSVVEYGTAVSTVYYPNMNEGSAFFNSLQERCPSINESLTEIPDEAIYKLTVCGRSIDSYCSPLVAQRSMMGQLDVGVAWPPASYPIFMEPAFSYHTDLRIRIDNEGCDGQRSYLIGYDILSEAGRMTCFWSKAGRFTAVQSTVVSGTPALWGYYGVAVTLLPTPGSDTTSDGLRDVCFVGGGLVRCSDINTKLVTRAGSSRTFFTDIGTTTDDDLIPSNVTLVRTDIF